MEHRYGLRIQSDDGLGGLIQRLNTIRLGIRYEAGLFTSMG